MSLPAPDIEKLRELAMKATPGPWEWSIEDYSMANINGPGGMEDHVLTVTPCNACQDSATDPKEWAWGRCTTPTKANALFIAAANPQTILALLGSLPSPVSVPEGDAREIARALDFARRCGWAVKDALGWRKCHEDDLVRAFIAYGREVDTAALLSAESRARREALERAAQIVEDGQETHSSKNESYFLTPRKPGNSAGLVYASAIRKLSLSSPEEG